MMIDTSAYSAFVRGDERLRSHINRDRPLSVSVVVVGELRAGFAAGRKQPENERLLAGFLDAPNVDLIEIDYATTQHYAEVYAQLRTTGRPIGSNDMWIAAHAIEHGQSLLSLDTHFGYVEGLHLVDV